MSKFVVLKSAGLGNRIKLYVSYLQRYDEVLIEKEPDLNYLRILNYVIRMKI